MKFKEKNKLHDRGMHGREQIAERDGRWQRIEEMRAFLEKQVNEPLAYDEQLIQKLVEKITVYEDRLAVQFKSGFEIDLERQNSEMTKCLVVRQWTARFFVVRQSMA